METVEAHNGIPTNQTWIWHDEGSRKLLCRLLALGFFSWVRFPYKSQILLWMMQNSPWRPWIRESSLHEIDVVYIQPAEQNLA